MSCLSFFFCIPPKKTQFDSSPHLELAPDRRVPTVKMEHVSPNISSETVHTPGSTNFSQRVIGYHSSCLHLELAPDRRAPIMEKGYISPTISSETVQSARFTDFSQRVVERHSPLSQGLFSESCEEELSRVNPLTVFNFMRIMRGVEPILSPCEPNKTVYFSTTKETELPLRQEIPDGVQSPQ